MLRIAVSSLAAQECGLTNEVTRPHVDLIIATNAEHIDCVADGFGRAAH